MNLVADCKAHCAKRTLRSKSIGRRDVCSRERMAIGLGFSILRRRFARRTGQVVLQTWHGTPLKRIHWDVLWAPEGRLDRLQRDVDASRCFASRGLRARGGGFPAGFRRRRLR